MSPPPLPLPERLIGSEWQFASLNAKSLEQELLPKPMPVQAVPPELLPSRFGIASTTPIPGLVVYGGRRSLKLAQWLAEQAPVGLTFVKGEPSGLVLATESKQRWVFLTFTDAEVIQAAQVFEERKAAAKGLHFVLVQPDNSGVTYTGVFLLQGS